MFHYTIIQIKRKYCQKLFPIIQIKMKKKKHKFFNYLTHIITHKLQLQIFLMLFNFINFFFFFFLCLNNNQYHFFLVKSQFSFFVKNTLCIFFTNSILMIVSSYIIIFTYNYNNIYDSFISYFF